MAKAKQTGYLNKLAKKSIVFNGKFPYGQEEYFKTLAKAQQGKVLDDLDASVDYLVLADLSAGKTIQKKVVSLNAKGATIQIIDAAAFEQMTQPTTEEIAGLIRTGDSERLAVVLPQNSYYRYSYKSKPFVPKYSINAEKFDGTTLSDVSFDDAALTDCRFVGATLNKIHFSNVTDCNFSKITAENLTLDNVTGCKFTGAKIKSLEIQGNCSNCDFNNAEIENLIIYWPSQPANAQPREGMVFTGAKLPGARMTGSFFIKADYSKADLTGAQFWSASSEKAVFRQAKLTNTIFHFSKLAGADFTKADCRGANFVFADLTDALVEEANYEGTNLRGATVHGVDFTKAKNLDPLSITKLTAGPDLISLDTVNAKWITITFRICDSSGKEDELTIDNQHRQQGWGIRFASQGASWRKYQSNLLSDAVISCANFAWPCTVNFESITAKSYKSPVSGKALWDLVVRAIGEAFGQEVPADLKPARAAVPSKAAREQAKQEREAAQAAAEKAKAKETKQLAKKIEKAVGKVNDVGTFLKALELRIEKPKIDKATKMLKASGFKLFNDVTGEFVSGVVKSQTDADLVYACRVSHDGQYACCTQNLNICGGLRGSICKHLLVLIIGLVQAGELDPATIDEWIAKTHQTKAELDKETMGAIFLKYKGAEAGEVDWRPTETMPEDYYAL